jgi:CheY-like chemotaxis protein
MKKILVVEDDMWLAEQHGRVLDSAGYSVSIAPHVFKAIEDIDEFNPDAIILDVLLTGNTGFTLLHELQSYDDTASIPIVLCTNLAPDITLESLKAYGVVRILDKATMHPDDLVAAIKGVLA